MKEQVATASMRSNRHNTTEIRPANSLYYQYYQFSFVRMVLLVIFGFLVCFWDSLMCNDYNHLCHHFSRFTFTESINICVCMCPLTSIGARVPHDKCNIIILFYIWILFDMFFYDCCMIWLELWQYYFFSGGTFAIFISPLIIGVGVSDWLLHITL